jgi:hypothetical protein
MSEIILQINDEMNMEKIIALLEPYIQGADLGFSRGEKTAPVGKVWDGKAEWLQNPVNIEGFTPLCREDIHVR